MSKTQPAEILTKPSLAALSLVLRHREMWPEGFEWDYADCATCAMGLAFRLGWATTPIIGDNQDDYGLHRSLLHMQAAFNLSERVARKFFAVATIYLNLDAAQVTPEHIADLIDAYLANAA